MERRTTGGLQAPEESAGPMGRSKLRKVLQIAMDLEPEGTGCFPSGLSAKLHPPPHLASLPYLVSFLGDGYQVPLCLRI